MEWNKCSMVDYMFCVQNTLDTVFKYYIRGWESLCLNLCKAISSQHSIESDNINSGK